MKLTLVFLITNIVFISSSIYAQESSTEAFDRTRTQINSTSLVPVLDGVLNDEIWQQATRISNFHQTSPVDHGAPSEQTEIFVTYSENYFYVGARMFDKNPSGINARQLIQGQSINSDDSIGVFLDSFNNSRTGFYFSTNPNGVRSEGVWEAANSFNSDWSGIWQVEATIDEQGWVAEFAIPFTTLNFDPTTEDWGFNLVRSKASNNERIAWSSFNRSTNPSTAGQISGIRDIRQGMGLDVVPSVTIATKEDHVAGTSDSRFDPSLDVFYKFTPNLTGALTLNTDFSATEVDDVQVNLTRFSLSFPEKRDFFLQDSEIFGFGATTGRRFGGGGGPSDADPFYSRKIGLDPATGQPVDIDVGGKIAGRVGDYSVGVLAVQQGDRIGLDGQNIFIGRVTR
ncbi:carbohydrate binding family 9 domain-containing protein, partial [bacterium AH-315-I11]|nr:carbohydrate binding family 9 domain-containing protein [bacterium AH-315-I11]